MNLLELRQFVQGENWTCGFAEAVKALRTQGGGTLTVPPGDYATGPIVLHDNMTLQLEKGATLHFLDDTDAYPLMDMEFEGVPVRAHQPLLFADGAENLRVTGEGMLNGNGMAWWQAARNRTLAHPRPYLVCFRHCKNVMLEGITLINSPCWTVHPLYCEDVTVRGLTIRNPKDSPNTDGIDPNGCTRVRIARCVIDVGDDCVAIKSGTEDTPNPRPCQDVEISECFMRNGHGGVVIGSEMSGGVRDVRVHDCHFEGTDRGIRLKTRRNRGGCSERLRFQNITMKDVMCPFVFNMFYFCGKGGKTDFVRNKLPQPVDQGTPAFRDIHISDMTVTNATACAGFAYGLPEMPIVGLSMRSITVTMSPGKPGMAAMMDDLAEMEASGFFMRNVQDASFVGVQVIGAMGEAILRDESVSGRFEEA